MKVQELYRQVAALGFEDSLESSARNRFYYTANRALLQISAVRPVIKSIVLKHRPLANLLTDSNAEKEVKGTLEFTAVGAKAYYFEFEGTGIADLHWFDVENEKWQYCTGSIELSFDNSGIRKGIIKVDGNFTDKQVRLTFRNQGYILIVKNVALYGAVYSDNTDLIPNNEDYIRYDLGALVDDFNGLHVPLIRDDGRFIKLGEGYDVENNRVILVSRDNPGNYRAQYYHKPTAISFSSDPQNNTDEIDLDDDLAALMPLLVASYLCLDEEPDRAQYYLSLYREGASTIKNAVKDMSPAVITTNGWA